jgi:hypothetical protein
MSFGSTIWRNLAQTPGVHAVVVASLLVGLLTACPAADKHATDAASGGHAALLADAAVGDAGLTSCGWQQVVADPTLRSAACHAARALLRCGRPDGDGAVCISNDQAACPSLESIVPCVDQCGAAEYALACGKIGVGLVPAFEAPAGCRDMGANPGGIVYYCCPCE